MLFLKRLFFKETAGRASYRYSRHGQLGESMDYHEFIARITWQIPDKGQGMIQTEEGNQSEDEHAVAVAVEAVLAEDSFGIGFLDKIETGEGGNHHQKG